MRHHLRCETCRALYAPDVTTLAPGRRYSGLAVLDCPNGCPPPPPAPPEPAQRPQGPLQRTDKDAAVLTALARTWLTAKRLVAITALAPSTVRDVVQRLLARRAVVRRRVGNAPAQYRRRRPLPPPPEV